ncbi:hypothetical protein PSI23_07035 [Xenorhabdus sp. XENO-10]|uniref:Uncharacterized protein n=1 Tax=Xenorhabdus yunnanensis TaxID=3025878 RepID=A0ABT5LF16_9GAMM|nr:hypothetical protein [Xenorhabdus yunnanensis]MDC9589078.1 hypothetical protein [Xenorhabdus yunnanensis]
MKYFIGFIIISFSLTVFSKNEFERVVICWKTANRLINWEIPDGDYDELYRLIIFSKPFIDINEYVVPY